MSERRWFRSLYWRIGLGIIVLVAVLMGAQAASFVWIAAATEGGVPQRAGQDFARLVASEFESALAANPALDLRRYAETRLAELHRPAFIFLRDGSIVGPAGTDIPPGLQRLADARERLGRLRPADDDLVSGVPPQGFGGGLRPGQRPGVEPRFRGMPPDAIAPGRPAGPAAPLADGQRPLFPRRRRAPPSDEPGSGSLPGGSGPLFARRPIAVSTVRDAGGQTVARVFVPPVVGLRRVTAEMGPWLAIGSLLLLVGGTAVAALLVFRPAHAQLRGLEEAARRFGEGDLAARAPASGGDEVAAVARAFNRMADDLAARQAQLSESDRARRQLLADVSHELMTPLTAIRGYADTLELPQFAPASPRGQRSVRVIQEEVERIDRLVGDLLDLARYDAAGTALVLEDVAVAELFDRVVARHEPAARAKQVTIDVRLPDEEMLVNADARRLEQALQNLAANALRHAPSGSTVTVSAEQRNDRTWLRVRDTGPGIAPAHLPHVFDRFYKADPSRSEAGSGLGLSIVKAIVERHGGTVEVTSTPGVVTEFEIVLPASSAPQYARRSD